MPLLPSTSAVCAAGILSDVRDLSNHLAACAPLHWRQWLGLASFGLLIGYAAYQCGWINGQHAGWCKARDEYRPNASHKLNNNILTTNSNN